MTLNTLSTGDPITTALLLQVMIERRILERNLLGVLLLGTTGEGLNLDEWYNLRQSVLSCICCAHSSTFLLLSSSLSIVDHRCAEHIIKRCQGYTYLYALWLLLYSILLSLSTNDILFAGFITVCDRTCHLGPSSGQDHGRGQVRKRR